MKISEAEILVIDTETTGLDATKDRIIEFGCRDSFGTEFELLVNPGMPIPYEVSAIHHLIDSDVADAIPYDEAMRKIDEYVPRDCVLVAQNAPFDRSFLPCLDERRWLCTKRLSQHLFPDVVKHSNQVLRYYFGLAKLDLHGLAPHRALADVIVTQAVLGKLVEKYLADGHGDDVDALLAFAASPIKVRTLSFGKHKGSLITDIASDYLSWMLSPRGVTDMDSDLRFTVEGELKARGFRT